MNAGVRQLEVRDPEGAAPLPAVAQDPTPDRRRTPPAPALPIRDVRLQAAILRGGELLLLHCRLPGGESFWLLPGGGREPGEGAAAALAREVREELGVAVAVGGVVYEVPAEPADGTYRRWRTYWCELTGGEPRAQGADGAATLDAVAWVPLGDEAAWPAGVADDRFLAPQLRLIRRRAGPGR